MPTVEEFINMMIVDLRNCKKSFPELTKDLDAMGKKVGCIIHAQHEDIFNMMHRIWFRQSTSVKLSRPIIDGNDHFTDYLKTESKDNTGLMQYLKDSITYGGCFSKFEDGKIYSTFTVRDSDESGYLAKKNFDFYYSMPCAVYCKGNDSDYSSMATSDLGMFCSKDRPYSTMVNDTRLNAVHTFSNERSMLSAST